MSTQHRGEGGGEKRVRSSGALFEDREEYWQLPLQEGSAGDWQKAAIDVEESVRTACARLWRCLLLTPSLNNLSGMRGDIWRSVIFSLIVTSKEAQCFVLCLLPWEPSLTFM